MSDYQHPIEQAAVLLQRSQYAVALTGAGASTESGIPDFRSKNGLWSRYDPYEYGTIGAFRRNPVKVWSMLKELLAITEAQPNEGHLALAELERIGLLKGIITQNIDGLHQQAGSKNVVEFHGSLATFSCLQCHHNYDLAEVLTMPIPPHCKACNTLLKPDVVFFDEQIPSSAISAAEKLLQNVDLLMVIGSSCSVVPASHLPAMVHSRGGKIIEINLEEALKGIADITLIDRFTVTMQKILHLCS